MKRVAVLTSGGDAPGMNAATRAGVAHGFETLDITGGVVHALPLSPTVMSRKALDLRLVELAKVLEQ